MKRTAHIALFFSLFLCGLVACHRQDPEETHPVPTGYKDVVLQASVAETKATLTDAGAFAWAAGDVISVLATDGNFYDFTCEYGNSFRGVIPENTEITTVATYPVQAENGTNDGVYAQGMLRFTLPESYAPPAGHVSVPMVASFAEGATTIVFKQVGGVFRFPVTNVTGGSFVAEFTFYGAKPTGTYSLDPTLAGTTFLPAQASTAPSSISVACDGNGNVYVPVATGTYTRIDIKFYRKDAAGERTFFHRETRTRSGNYTVQRTDLYLMNTVTSSNSPVNNLISAPGGVDYDVYKVGNRFPISYWWHPFHDSAYGWSVDPVAESTVRQIKECGMNILLAISAKDKFTVAETQALLAHCHTFDMRLIAQGSTDLWWSSASTRAAEFAAIDQYAGDPYYVGHVMGDEPGGARFPQYQETQKAYEERYPGRVAFANLFPAYANTGQLGYPSYEQYIDAWMAGKGLHSISFDSYPNYWDGAGTRFGVISSHYYALDLIRAKTLAAGKHFWMIGLSGWTMNQSVQRTDEIRWYAFSAIAMGSKGYSYFCYYFPSYNGGEFEGYTNDKRFLVDLHGNPTDNYYIAQRLNSDIQVLGAKLCQSHADGCIMPDNSTLRLYESRTGYGALSSVTGSTCVVGCFRAPDGKYQAVVTNRIPSTTGTDTINATLHFDNTVHSVTATYTADHSVQTLPVTGGTLNLSFPEGEAYLIEWD